MHLLNAELLHVTADDDATQGRRVQIYPFVYPLATLLGSMKNAGLRIRIERELREQFLEACRAQDRPAAQVIREFIRDFLRQQDAPMPVPSVNKRQKRMK